MAKKKEVTNQDVKSLLGGFANSLTSALHACEVQLTLLRKLLVLAGDVGGAANASADEEDEEEEVKPAKKGKKQPAKSFDEDDEDEEEENEEAEEEEKDDEDENDDGEEASDDSEEDEEEEEDAPPPAKKAKKLTADDVNDACKDRIKRTGCSRADVLAILKKKFKVSSVTDLKPEQYADVIKAMAK